LWCQADICDENWSWRFVSRTRGASDAAGRTRPCRRCRRCTGIQVIVALETFRRLS
jgi:hypothetical protein